MNSTPAQDGRYEQRVRGGVFQLICWTAAWVLSAALVAYGPRLLGTENIAIAVALFALNIGIGLGMILAHKKHLNNLDEMQRKVTFDAMGITLGVFVVVGTALTILDRYGLPQADEIEHILFVMAPTYVISMMIGLRRYR